jgi:transposase InsO family protein
VTVSNIYRPGDYPYLLKGLEIKHANQVWATDITYNRLPTGRMPWGKDHANPIYNLCVTLDLTFRTI